MLERRYTRVWTERERLIGLHLKKSLRQRFQKSFSDIRPEIKRLSRSARFELTSYNSFSRRFWFRTLGEHLCSCLRAKRTQFVPKHPVFLLTLIDRNQVINPDIDLNGRKENPTFDQIHSAYDRRLAGLDCLGMLDAALYVSMQRTHYVDRLINYHCHVLVWNTTAAAMEERCQAIRATTEPFLSYATSADAKPVNAADLLQVLWYSTKTPRSQYQLHRRHLSRRLKQFKRPINGVNSVRLYAELGRRTLEELTLAHGQGKAVLTRMLRDARRWERRG